MKKQYRQRPHSLDEIAATFIAGLPMEDQLQASLDWNERKRDVAKQLKIESEAANLLNQGLMKLETDRVEIVAQMKRAVQEIKDAEKRFAEWQVKLAAHDKLAARFMPKPKGKPKKAKRQKRAVEASKAAAEHIEQHQAAYGAENFLETVKTLKNADKPEAGPFEGP